MPPAAAPVAAPANVVANQPAATNGPTPGMANSPRPVSNPTPPPTISADASAWSCFGFGLRSRGIYRGITPMGVLIGDHADLTIRPKISCRFQIGDNRNSIAVVVIDS